MLGERVWTAATATPQLPGNVILAAHTSALPIHFEDHRSLASFEAPDGGHLDHADAVVFTRAF